MLKFSIFLFLIIFLYADINTTKTSPNKVVNFNHLKFLYENGVRDYRIGSYYDAINEFNHLAKYPNSPYYLDSLFYLAKTYLQIGKRTGEKKYLWTAQNFLNMYLSNGGKKNVDYYFLKGEIYEILGFYERALSNYKIALNKSKTKTDKLKILIGILRTAVWLQKLDLATKYIVILSIENLSKEQKKEFEFLKGMYSFVKGDYETAIRSFQQSYRKYESFLIQNPEYYYIVAENSYRIGDYQFASRLFRRILNYIKNKKVIQKTLLRLGDIFFLQGNIKASVGYYYRLMKDFPKSSYATIAKLKVLYMMDKDKKIAFYIKKFFKDASFIKDPDKFIIQTLVKNRNNYIGIFALANFGRRVFEIDTDNLFKRLSWEISMLPVSNLKYEHREYFRKVWRDKIFTIDPKYLRDLIKSNQKLFFAIFRKSDLLSLVERLKKTNDKKLIVKLYEKIASKYHDDRTLLLIAKELYNYNEFRGAQKILTSVKEKNCPYWFLNAKLCYVLKRECKDIYKIYLYRCGSDPFYKGVFTTFLRKKISLGFIRKNIDRIKKEYNDPLIKGFVKYSVEMLIKEKQYGKIIELLAPLVQSLDDCYLKSILSLSYIRSGKIQFAKSILGQIKNCNEKWFLIAKNAILDIELEQKVKNVGKN